MTWEFFEGPVDQGRLQSGNSTGRTVAAQGRPATISTRSRRDNLCSGSNANTSSNRCNTGNFNGSPGRT